MTTTDDLIVRAQAVLDAAEKMTPGPWKARGVMIDPEIACIPHRPSMYTLGRTDESTPADDARADTDATGIAILRNAAPAVIRDLLARLADQARGLTVGAPEIERIILDDPLSEIDAAAEEWDPGHILRVNREQRVEIARMRAEIARMRGMLASNRRDFTDGWVACAEYRGVDIDHDALERALDADRNPAERGPL